MLIRVYCEGNEKHRERRLVARYASNASPDDLARMVAWPLVPDGPWCQLAPPMMTFPSKRWAGRPIVAEDGVIRRYLAVSKCDLCGNNAQIRGEKMAGILAELEARGKSEISLRTLHRMTELWNKRKP